MPWCIICLSQLRSINARLYRSSLFLRFTFEFVFLSCIYFTIMFKFDEFKSHREWAVDSKATTIVSKLKMNKIRN